MARARNTVPLHQVRPARRRARVPVAPAEPAAPAFEAGHFLALVRRHDWPPSFEPMFVAGREAEQSEIARINRERRVANGDPGTILGLSQRSDELIRQRLTTMRAFR